MKKMLKFALVILVSISFLFIPSAFVFQDYLHGAMHKILKLRIKSSFLGGELQYTFRDNLGDNRGSGSLSLPLNPVFTDSKDNFFDLTTFSIHSPQLDEDWSSNDYYWQLTYGVKEISGLEVISHYWGFTEHDSTSVLSDNTFPERAENIRFSKDYPWEFKIVINGYLKVATLYNGNGVSLGDVPLLIDDETNRFIVRLPLKYNEIRRVLKNSDSYHYVMVGVYNSMAIGYYNPVSLKRSIYNGGGAKSSKTPRIYDYFAPKGFSLEDLEKGELQPLLAFSEFREDINKKVDVESMYKIIANRRNEYSINSGNSLTKEEIEVKLIQEPNNSQLLSSLGAIIAKEGGSAENVSEAMERVYKAYELFDFAEKNILNNEDRLTLALNRGYVSMPVPESVFKKAKIGGDDFVYAAEYYMNSNLDLYTAAEYYLNAYTCYKEALMETLGENYLYMAIAIIEGE
ncbi:MAG: hypothetical protein JXR64_01555 [Spirochaetales bacterium]|nr:hypothetical protein [Spirochaetales bacterium]